MLRLLPKLEPEERGRVLLASLGFICVATGALVARTFGDSLFLSRLGSGGLPYVYIGGAAATAVASYVCAHAARRHSTAQIGIVVAALLIGVNLAVFAVLDLLPRTASIAAYLLADLTVRIPILLYWALASEVFDVLQARRLFGLLGAAGTAACLPAGLLVGPMASRLGIGSLAPAAGLLMAGFLISTRAMARREPGERPPSGPRSLTTASRGGAIRLQRSPQFLTIVALVAVTSLVQTLVDYQFKAAYAPVGRSEALAAVFGNLYAIASIASLFLQLFVVHRALQWGGILFSLSLLPAGLALGAVGVLRTAAPSWAFVTKALDVTLTTSFNGTTRQLLYRGIRKESRLQARALAEGAYQPLAIGIAGALLFLVLESVTIRVAALATLIGCGVWLLLARTSYRAYVAGLIHSLRRRRLDVGEESFLAREPAVEAYVRETLGSAPDDETGYLLAVLSDLGDFTSAPELVAALQRDDPRIKIAVLDYLRRRGTSPGLGTVQPLAAHPDPEVRRAAVRTGAMHDSPAVQGWLRERLEDPEARVRAAAAEGLARGADPDAARQGRALLEEMVASPVTEFQAAAASVLRGLAGDDVTGWLVRLLASRDEATLLAALEACRRHPDAALAPAIIPLLADKRLAGAAADALAAMGNTAYTALAASVEDPAWGAAGRSVRRIVALLARLDQPEALPLLQQHLATLAPEESAATLRAYAALSARLCADDASRRDLELRIARELHRARTRLAGAGALEGRAETALLRAALLDLYRCHVQNAFLLLEGRLPGVDVKALQGSLLHGSRESRSQALELLQNVLPEAIRKPFLGVLGAAPPVPRPGPDLEGAVAAGLADDASDWVVAGAVHGACELRLGSTVGEIRRLVEHRSAIVRETALHALSQMDDPDVFLRTSKPHLEDPDPSVRATARRLRGVAPGDG